jgi:hypothetical protein
MNDMPQPPLHPHDIGLTPPAIRNRRHAHRIARWMLTIAILTAIPGWFIFGASILSAITLKTESPFKAVAAYAILIISSVTLILGLWYLLLAQVSRVARITSLDRSPDPELTRCNNCGWPCDPPDRFCRHCGKPLFSSP